MGTEASVAAATCACVCVCLCVRLDTCKLLLLEKPVFFFPPRWAGGRMCTALTVRPTVRKLLPGWTQSRDSISERA